MTSQFILILQKFLWRIKCNGILSEALIPILLLAGCDYVDIYETQVKPTKSILAENNPQINNE